MEQELQGATEQAARPVRGDKLRAVKGWKGTARWPEDPTFNNQLRRISEIHIQTKAEAIERLILETLALGPFSCAPHPAWGSAWSDPGKRWAQVSHLLLATPSENNCIFLVPPGSQPRRGIYPEVATGSTPELTGSTQEACFVPLCSSSWRI